MVKRRVTFDELLELAQKRYQPPRRTYSEVEHQLQISCVKWFNLKYPYLRGRLFAVPNGGRRDMITGLKLKEEGVVAGVSDLILLKSNQHYGALLIEMKRKDGRQSDNQKWWQSVVCAEGEYKYVICRSLDDFMREVNDYLNNT